MRSEVWILDRKTAADEAVVFLEDGSSAAVPAAQIPGEARPGDRLLVEIEPGREAVEIRVRIDRPASRAAREAVEERLERLRADDPGGDVEL